MNINLTQKEKLMLEDQKSHEETCIQKYNKYANETNCQQLKGIFTNNAKIEQEHLNTINQLLNGQVPAMNQSQQSGTQQQTQQQGQQQQMQQSFQDQRQQFMQKHKQQQINQQISGSTGSSGSQNYNQTDKDLCTDMLMTEKYVSGAYDTAIFEFKDPQVRSVLNHIQNEEQQHGESIFKYMESKGMYQIK